MENNNSKESVDQNKETVCGPDCDCHVPSSNNKTKVIAGLVILFFAVSVFAYKMIRTKPIQESADTYTAIADKNNLNTLSPSVEKTNPPAIIPNQTPKKMYVGEYLDSFNSLNKVAINQDAVFVLVQGEENESVKKEVETAMLGVQLTLKTNNVNAGLYTLQTSAPEYKNIIQQFPSPFIIVACKGLGMNAVQGDVTEAKLLQAFIAVSQAGGCGPSGCGPSNSTCP